MKCPHCGEAIDLAAVSPKILAREAGKQFGPRRKSYTGGIFWTNHNPDWPGCRCQACMTKRSRERLADRKSK